MLPFLTSTVQTQAMTWSPKLIFYTYVCGFNEVNSMVNFEGLKFHRIKASLKRLSWFIFH